MFRLAKTIGLITALFLVSCMLISCGTGDRSSDALEDFLSEDDSKTLEDHLKLAIRAGEKDYKI